MRRLPAVAVAAALLFLLGPPTGATAAGGADVFVYMDGPTTAYVGQTLYYDIGSGNRGPDVATGVVLTDTMPAGTTFLPSQSDPCWTQSGTTLTCRIGYEYANAVGETRLALRAPDTAGSVTNAVRITMDQTDPTPADDAASLTTSITVPTDADIEVDLNAVSDRVEVGSYAYFDVGVVNNGPADATGVSITDQLPDGMVFVPSLSDAACAAAGQTITCTVGFVGNHAVTDPYRITAQTTKLGSFTDTATATANQPDPNLSNNSASTSVTVFGPADLSLTIW
jgi:uncharacterized repeat protein (TIGR01451 family)